MHSRTSYYDSNVGLHNEITSLPETTDPRREPHLNLQGLIALSKVQKCDLSSDSRASKIIAGAKLTVVLFGSLSLHSEQWVTTTTGSLWELRDAPDCHPAPWSHPAFHGHQLSLGEDVNHCELTRVRVSRCVCQYKGLIPSIYFTEGNHKATSGLEWWGQVIMGPGILGLTQDHWQPWHTSTHLTSLATFLRGHLVWSAPVRKNNLWTQGEDSSSLGEKNQTKVEKKENVLQKWCQDWKWHLPGGE